MGGSSSCEIFYLPIHQEGNLIFRPGEFKKQLLKQCASTTYITRSGFVNELVILRCLMQYYYPDWSAALKTKARGHSKTYMAPLCCLGKTEPIRRAKG